MQIKHLVSGDGEEWVYGADDDVRLVVVSRTSDGEMQVSVGAAEFVREEPLESRLRVAVMTAISDVDGVDDAHEEDREVWTVEGDPDGEALAWAVAAVIESMFAELSAHVDALG